MAKTSYRLDTRRPLQDGRYPLKIVVSHKQKTLLISTGNSFTEKEWEDVQAQFENPRRMTPRVKAIQTTKSKIDNVLAALWMEGKLDKMDFPTLKSTVMMNVFNKEYESQLGASGNFDTPANLFLPYYRERIEAKETQGTKDVYDFTLKLIQRFEESNGRDAEDLTFEDITPAWLLAFDNWMSPTNGVNSRSKNMRNIRAVFNDAIEEGRDVNYPFSRSSSKRKFVPNDGKRKFRIVTNLHTKKRSLTLEQLRLLRDYPCAPHQVQYRDMFMLMVYLIGINAADLFTSTPDQIVNGRLEYDRQKTHRGYSIKIEPEAMEIINRYRGNRLLLAPCENYADYRSYLQHMNIQLKEIGIQYIHNRPKGGKPLFPELSSMWARHTWSTIATNIDIPKDHVGKSLGHSWAFDSVTDIYINMDEKKIDEANRKVIDALNNLPVILRAK